MNVVAIVDSTNWSAYTVMSNVAERSKHNITVKLFCPPSNLDDVDLVYYRYGALASKHQINRKNTKWVLGISGHGCLGRCRKNKHTFSDWASNFDAMTANSMEMMGVLERTKPDFPTFLCHSGVDTKVFKPTPFPEEFHIGWAGKISGGFKRLVDLKKLPFPKKLSVVGGGSGRSHSEMPKFFEGISVYVSTSLKEGSPLPPKEAAACGRPVTGLSAGDLPEWIPPRWLVPGEREAYKELIPNIKIFQSNPEYLELIGKQFRKISLRWDYDIVVHEYDKMIDEVMEC